MVRIFLFAVAMLILACKEKEESIVIDAEPGTIKMTVGGVTMTTASNNMTMGNVQQSHGFVSGCFEPSNTKCLTISVKSIGVGVFDISGKEMPGFFTEAEYNDGTFTLSSRNLQETSAGTLKITQLDQSRKVMSGTFEVRVAGHDLVIAITKGSFNQLPFN